MYYYCNLRLQSVNPLAAEDTFTLMMSQQSCFLQVVASHPSFAVYCFVLSYCIFVCHSIYTAPLDFPFIIYCHVGRTDVSRSFNVFLPCLFASRDANELQHVQQVLLMLCC
jgi:hypothetical protein